MPKSDFDAFDQQSFAEIKQLVAQLQRSHQQRSKMVNLEFSALAVTMDHFLPGFWSRFLANRRTGMQDFIKNKRSLNTPTTEPKPEI
ncbi:MAG: hypothetical protein WBG73_08035 [Coleofasciculaceae cyanobacterium]